MIKIETVLTLLKKDHNFREIIENERYYFHRTSHCFHHLSYSSETVAPGTLFFVKGKQFKKDYLTLAIEKGATYYISEKDYQVGIPVILVNHIKQAMSLIAMEFYGNPQNKLSLLAFTGTKGKTTAAYFAYHILKQEYKPALLSTVSTTLDGETFFKSSLTTPESLDLFAMMAQAVKNGRSHLIMEVSSQAYLLKRVYGLQFDVGVFLNISPDHIGKNEHPTFEDYFYHKRLLLENSKKVILYADTAYTELFSEQVKEKEVIFYGKNSPNHILHSSAFHFQTIGQLASDFSCQLLGYFNQENALAAGLSCLQLGASVLSIQTGIATTTVPGRMEILTQKNGAKVFIDYAHNGLSLNQLIQVVQTYQAGKVLLVIGSTGNKGENRRADFAGVINSYPQMEVILTADDPNFEDPFTIAQEIAQQINRPVHIETDRSRAIALALSMTRHSADAVIIAGKGEDRYQIIQGEKTPYDGDGAIAKRYL